MDEELKLYKIGEVSSLTGISAATIRFWESKYSLLKPERGTNGYRYYSKQDIGEILAIKQTLSQEKGSLKLISYAKSDATGQNEPGNPYPSASDLRDISYPVIVEALERFLQLSKQFTEVALKDKELEDSIRERTTVIAEATNEIVDNSKSDDSLIQILANLLLETLSVDFCAVVIPSVAKTYTALRNDTQSVLITPDALLLEMKSFAAASMDEMRSIIVEGAERRQDERPITKAIKAMVIAPVQSRGMPSGYTAVVSTRAERRFRSDEIDLVRVFANLVAISFRNSTICGDESESGNLEREVAHLNREISAISAVAEIVTRPVDLEEMLEAILDKALDVIGVEIGQIFLLDERAGELILKVYRGSPSKLVQEGSIIKLGTGVAGRVALTGELIVVPNISEDPRRIFVSVKEENLGSYVCVPLKSKQKVFGTMSAISYALRPFTSHDIQLLTTIGRQVGAAIENAYLYRQTLFAEREKTRDLREQLAEVAYARDEERRRVARELHDGVAQLLASLAAKIDADSRSQEFSGLLEPRLQEYKSSIKEALDSVRRSIYEERVPLLDRLGLVEALENEIRLHFKNRIQCEVEFEIGKWPAELPKAVSYQLYRIIIECLLNIEKHAQASHASLRLDVDETHLRIDIKDNGLGFDLYAQQGDQLPSTSFGLKGCKERAAQIGGNFEIFSKIGEGTRICISVPRNWREDEREDIETTVRVMVVDDHPLYRRVITDILREERNIEVIGVASDGEQAIDIARSLTPDVIVMDINLPRINGLEATRAITASNPDVRTVLLSVFDQEKYILAGLRAGAVDYLPKDCKPDEIVRAVQAAYRGDHLMSPQIADRLLEMLKKMPEGTDAAEDADGLTPREAQVLKLVAAGKPAKQIATHLGITHKTVRTHISNIYHKLQIYDRAQVVLYALRKGLVIES